MQGYSYIFIFTWTSLGQVLGDDRVPVWTLCSSLCKVTRHGHISSVVCHTLTPNSFGVNITDRTSRITARQVIQQIAREGIQNSHCSSLSSEHQTTAKETEQAAGGFKASSICVSYGQGTYSYNIKKNFWQRVGGMLMTLRSDRKRGLIYGSKSSAIYEIDKDKMRKIHAFEDGVRIKSFDIDSITGEFYILKHNFRIYNGRKKMKQITLNADVTDLRVDEKKRSLYIIVLSNGRSVLASLPFGAGDFQPIFPSMNRLLFCGHFDYLKSRLVLRYKGLDKMKYFPLQREKPVLNDKTIDVDYDDENVFMISKGGNVMARKRHGRWGLIGKPRVKGVTKAIAVI